MDQGCEGGNRCRSPRAEALKRETETFAVAARGLREGPGMAKYSELTGGGSEIRSLSGGCAPDFVARDASREPIEVLVWKVISCASQTINGLRGSNHEYPRMADIEWASGVNRNRTFGSFHQGTLRRRW